MDRYSEVVEQRYKIFNSCPCVHHIVIHPICLYMKYCTFNILQILNRRPLRAQFLKIVAEDIVRQWARRARSSTRLSRIQLADSPTPTMPMRCGTVALPFTRMVGVPSHREASVNALCNWNKRVVAGDVNTRL